MGNNTKKFRAGRSLLPSAMVLALALSGLLASCSSEGPSVEAPRPAVEVPEVGAGPSPDVVARFNPAPLQVHPQVKWERMRNFSPVDTASSPPLLSSMAIANEQVAMRILVIAAVGVEDVERGSPLRAWQLLLEQAGIPFDVLISSEEELTVERLIDEDGVGRYYGVLLTTNQLAYSSNGVWTFTFEPHEWALLHQYEREYGVRQASLYSYPGAYPEEMGVRDIYGDGLDPDPRQSPATAIVTPAGEGLFRHLASDAQIVIDNSYIYRSELLTGITGVEPLLLDEDGHILATTRTAVDGRENLDLFFAGGAWDNSALLHTQLFGPEVIDWVTRGVYIGERQMFLGADIDDWFFDSDLWDRSLNDGAGGVIDDGFNLSGDDALSFATQLANLKSTYAGTAPEFTWTMAYNGSGAKLDERVACEPGANLAGLTLSAVTSCLADDFWWVNHTFTHRYMDPYDPPMGLSKQQVIDEIVLNDEVADQFNLLNTDSPHSLVTGDISGLGWYATAGPGQGMKSDLGLLASSQNLLDAAVETGRLYLASNMSTKSHEPDCIGCGIYHPMREELLLVPRWPTNVFVHVTTPEDAISAFNTVYLTGMPGVYWEYPIDYNTYLDVDTNTALAHILSGAPYQHYFHVANLHDYGGGNSLLTDWAGTLLGKYSSLMRQPLLTLPWDELGKYVADRTSFMAANVSGIWDRAENTITLSSEHSGTAFVTGLDIPGASFTYGQDRISKVNITPANSITVAFNGGSAPIPTPLTVAIDVLPVGAGTVTGVDSEAVYYLGSRLTLTAVPAAGWRFGSWSGVTTSGANPLDITLSGNISVAANFLPKIEQTITFDSPVDGDTFSQPFIVSASSDSGLPVAFSATGVCSVDGAAVTLTGGAGECSITASQPGDDTYLPALPVTRTFNVAPATFTLSVAIVGQGTVAAEGLNDGEGSYGAGTAVELVATPAEDHRFLGWDSEAEDTTNPRNVVMAADVALTAYFAEKIAQTITFEPLGNLLASSPPFELSATVDSPLPLTFTAAGVCSVEGTTVTLSGVVGVCTVTASQPGNDIHAAAIPVVRAFDVLADSGTNPDPDPNPNPDPNPDPDPKLKFHTVTVNLVGSGFGLTISSPASLVCSDECNVEIAEGTRLTLVAVPLLGSQFEGWEGVCSGLNSCSFTVKSDAVIRARFGLDQ